MADAACLLVRHHELCFADEFRGYFSQRFKCGIDNDLAALATGDTSEEQDGVIIIELSIPGHRPTEIDPDGRINISGLGIILGHSGLHHLQPFSNGISAGKTKPTFNAR